MRNERAWLQQCWKSCANGSNIVALRFGDHGTKEMLGVVGWKVWPVSNFAQQHPTTRNRVCKRTQHVTSNNVAPVCTGLDVIARIFPENDKFTASYQTMKYLPKALCISNVANNKNELWKTVLKNHNYNPFQSSSCLSIHASFCICCVFIPYLSVLRLYFMFYSLWWQLSLFRATAPVSRECSIKSHDWMALGSI